MTTWRLYPSTSGAGSGINDPSQYVMGVSFKVTSPSLFFAGWYHWVAPSGQATGAEDFALWQVNGANSGTYIAGSKVTSGAFTAGQWNFVAANSPIALTSGQEYRAIKTVNKGNVEAAPYSGTAHYFDTTGAANAGIVNGPLLAYAAGGQATNPEPNGEAQMVFLVNGTDVTAAYPSSGFNNTNYWLDVQITDSGGGGGGGSPGGGVSGGLLLTVPV